MNASILLNSAMESYSFEFVMNNIYPDMQLSIQVGTETSNVTFDNIKLARKPEETVTTINQVEMENELLYPNPASEIIYISADPGSMIIICDAAGRCVKLVNDVSPGSRLDISDLNSGFYIVKVMDGNKLQLQKLVKR